MKILIVVDMQNDFITGSLGTPEAQAIVPNVVKKIKEYDSEDNIIICTRDTHGINYSHSIEGKHLPITHCCMDTEGWQIEPSVSTVLFNVANPHNIHIIDKHSFGADTLGDYLIVNRLELESIELCGLCTDFCVISNAIIAKAKCYDTPIIVDASCCAGSTPEAHRKALELMRDSLQIDVINWR